MDSNLLVNKQKSRLTIGYLSTGPFDEYDIAIRSSIINAIKDNNVNLLCFSGRELENDENDSEVERNVIYDLISKNKLDGLILPAAALTNFVSRNVFLNFIKRFTKIPLVCIGLQVKKIPGILIDNKKGMYDLMVHLVKDHKYKNIAYIQGPRSNPETAERFKIYKKVLKEYGIAYNKKWAVRGSFDFTLKKTSTYIDTLLDKRKLSLDAIVCCNDAIALSVIKVLTKRGINVPKDIAVTGFDNIARSLIEYPILTTVNQPIARLGEEAFACLLKLINKEKVPLKKVLPTEVVVRHSCGCYGYTGLKIGNKKISNVLGYNLQHEIIQQLKNTKELKEIWTNKDFKWEEKICSLLKILSGKDQYNTKEFLFKLEMLIYEGFKINIEIFTWNIVLSKLFKILQKYIKSNKNYIISLYDDVNIIIGNIAERFRLNFSSKEIIQDRALYLISSSFLSCFKKEKVINIILNYFPHIGIKKCYVCLYTGKNRKYARMLVGYDKERDLVFKNVPEKFLSKNIFPDIVKVEESSFVYIIMALFFEQIHLGFIVFDAEEQKNDFRPDIYNTYDNLAMQLSSTLRGINFMQKISTYSRNLEKKVKKRTRELEKLNKKLHEIDSLKNDFIANITHDFRSPLTVILNVADLARRCDFVDEKVKENFSIIYKSSLRLNNSINRLLDLAKMDAHGLQVKISKVELVSVVAGMLDFYKSSVLGSGIKLEKKFHINKIKDFYTDIDKLEEIIDNIISNAIKFVDPNNGRIVLELKETDDRVQIIVTDNGVGISKERLETIFNRFEQAHAGQNSQYKGTGIGLAFARQLVEYLNGRIWAESEGEGKGSKFVIELKKDKNFFNKEDLITTEVKPKKYFNLKKLIEAELEDKLQTKETVTVFKDLNKENEFNYKKGIILIIDDDKNIRNIILRYLENYGYSNFVITATGKQGLNAVYEYNPDIIICDYNMPCMKGDEIHNQLAGNPEYNEIPFIFLSAVADENLILERRKKGANAYLKKPIDEEIFLITIEEHLKKYYERLKIIRLATIDELTGLNNRRSIINSFKHELAIRTYRDVSILFFDVDCFKGVNDMFGHQVGDDILRTIGETLRSKLRSYDIPGRYGGDEFIVILPDTNLKDACFVAESLKKEIGNLNFVYSGKTVTVSCSFGVASLKDNASYIEKELGINKLPSIYTRENILPAAWEDIDRLKIKISELLLKMADMALYNAKYTLCNKCGFKSEQSSFFENDLCPKCKSSDLSFGRNKVVGFE